MNFSKIGKLAGKELGKAIGKQVNDNKQNDSFLKKTLNEIKKTETWFGEPLTMWWRMRK